MHVDIFGFSRPLPHLSPADWAEYLRLCEMLGSGSGLPRTIIQTGTRGGGTPTNDIRDYLDPTAASTYYSDAGNKVTQSGPVPYAQAVELRKPRQFVAPEPLPTTEITIVNYMRVVQHRRRLVAGYRLPPSTGYRAASHAPYREDHPRTPGGLREPRVIQFEPYTGPAHVSVFGANRFPTMLTSPAFPDETPVIARHTR